MLLVVLGLMLLQMLVDLIRDAPTWLVGQLRRKVAGLEKSRKSALEKFEEIEEERRELKQKRLRRSRPPTPGPRSGKTRSPPWWKPSRRRPGPLQPDDPLRREPLTPHETRPYKFGE